MVRYNKVSTALYYVAHSLGGSLSSSSTTLMAINLGVPCVRPSLCFMASSLNIFSRLHIIDGCPNHHFVLSQRDHHKGITEDAHVIKFIRNIYGQKQAGRVWNKYLDEGMKEVGFTPSEYDPCLYYKKNVVMLVYIDDCLVFSPDPKLIDKTISDFRISSKNFDIDNLGDVGDFLGIDVTHLKHGSIKLTQPHPINAILKDLDTIPTGNG